MLDWYKPKFMLIPLLLLFFIPLALAVPPFAKAVIVVPDKGLIIDHSNFNYHKEYNYFELIVHVYNKSDGMLMTNETTSCAGHLYNSSGEEVIDIPFVTTKNNKHEFVFATPDPTNLHSGDYGWNIHCNASNDGGYAAGNFLLTETGEKTITVENTEDELLLYFVMALAIILLIVALWKEDPHLAAISGMLMIILGGYIILYGFSTLRDNLSNVLGIVIIAVGAYIFLKSTLENLQGG